MDDECPKCGQPEEQCECLPEAEAITLGLDDDWDDAEGEDVEDE